MGLDMPKSFKIYNALGNIVKIGEIINNKPINLEGVIPGFYFMKINNKDVIKFIKK